MALSQRANPRLTAAMRDTLEQATRGALRRTHNPGPGHPAWPAHPNTLAALLRHELVDHTVDRDRHGNIRETWTITDNGRHALHPPPRLIREKPRSLRVPGGHTRLHVTGDVWEDVPMPEPEPVNPNESRISSATRRQTANRLASRVRRAA